MFYDRYLAESEGDILLRVIFRAGCGAFSGLPDFVFYLLFRSRSASGFETQGQLVTFEIDYA